LDYFSYSDDLFVFVDVISLDHVRSNLNLTDHVSSSKKFKHDSIMMTGHYRVGIIVPIRILIIFVFRFFIIFLCHVGHRNIIDPDHFRHWWFSGERSNLRGWWGALLPPLCQFRWRIFDCVTTEQVAWC